MPNAIIYLDESGDLGWKLDAPYMQGGSSRHLTISAVCAPSDKKHLPGRIVKDLYQQFKWPTTAERKWVDMPPPARIKFASAAQAMCERHPDIRLHGIVVRKENVMDHIRRDANKLYNYMIGLSLLDRMAGYDEVILVPDPRSIKVQSGNSLPDYLQTQLWFEKKTKTRIIYQPTDSRHCLGIQFADMLAGVIQSKFEKSQASALDIVQSQLTLNRLYFG